MIKQQNCSNFKMKTEKKKLIQNILKKKPRIVFK